MRTETINVYTFDELTDEQKHLVFENWRASGHEYAGAEEWIDSLKGFAESTGIRIDNYQLSPYVHSFVTWTPDFDHDGNLVDLCGLRLRTWLINNWLPGFETGKYYSTRGQTINGKYSYKFKHSKCQFEIGCPFTGVGHDFDLINPALDFIKKPDGRNLTDVIDACFESFVKGYCADMEDQDSDEYITETIEANDYEFYSDGTLA